MRELNRLGVTSAIDAGGGFQNYPDDYQVIEQLARDGQLARSYLFPHTADVNVNLYRHFCR